MTRSHLTAVLWFLGGAAFIVAGFISEPRHRLTFGVGILFIVVGLVTLRRSRGTGDSPGA